MSGDSMSIMSLLNAIQGNQTCKIMDDITVSSLTTGRQYHQLVLPYNPDAEYPEVEVPIELKIDPRKFQYEWYENEYNSKITEQDARERMTDYHFKEFNPLKLKLVDEHYYIPGPDPDKEPTKRKFYNALSWYASYYDGKHGQKTEVKIEKEIDISAPIWQNLIVAMAVSQDYTLQEALYAVAMACDRCRHALLNKYYPESGEGYSTDSKDYRNSSYRCKFCSNY